MKQLTEVLTAFVGMATKYGEIVLGMLYRERDETGDYVGGPMYYIKKGIHAPWLAAICAFCMVIQIISGNFIQSNTISGVLLDNFGIPCAITGLLLVILIFAVTLGGLKRLANVTQRLVPVMACIYVVAVSLLLFCITTLTIQDIALGFLTIPNLIAIVLLCPQVRQQTKEFFGK